MKRFLVGAVLAGMCHLAAVLVSVAHADAEPLSYEQRTLKVRGFELSAEVPRGYELELLTEEMDAPRMLTFASNGDLFIGSRSGAVYRLTEPYNAPQILVKLSDYPHSVAFKDDSILVARTSGVYQAPYAATTERLTAKDFTLLAALPGGRGHDSRTVRVGPDGRIYASLGIAGNCSDQFIGPGYAQGDQRGGVVVLDEAGSTWQPFGSGLRNPVGFDWHPQSGVMYASNNGPDHWGYERPPEYFSRVTEGSFHGMPWFQFDGESLKRDECIGVEPPRGLDEVIPPAATFPSRNAPMGVAFVPSDAMDPTLTGDAVVALHGSWATEPNGDGGGSPATRRPPKLVVVRFDADKAVRVDDLVSGFQLEDGSRWARPAGVAIGPDGALYFTSDAAINGLFRLVRREP